MRPVSTIIHTKFFFIAWLISNATTLLSTPPDKAHKTLSFFTIFFTLGLVEIPNWLTSDQLLSLIIYSVIAMAISQVFFIAAIDKVGVAISSLHLNFSPFYVMIILFVMGGTWDLRAVIGASIVAFGVWLAQVK